MEKFLGNFIKIHNYGEIKKMFLKYYIEKKKKVYN